jgi:hypothetical protein
MYKLRLARWKIFKYMARKSSEHSKCPNNLKLSYSGRGMSLCPSCGQVVEDASSSSSSSLSMQPPPLPQDEDALVVLHSIREWTESNFEFLTSPGAPTSLPEKLPGARGSDSVYYSFALSSALFTRDAGHLAGKAVRKAFIATEGALQNLDAKLMWNLVDVVYQMVQLDQVQMLQLFLLHVADLGAHFLSDRHPIVRAFKRLAQLPDANQAEIIRQAWQ